MADANDEVERTFVLETNTPAMLRQLVIFVFQELMDKYVEGGTHSAFIAFDGLTLGCQRYEGQPDRYQARLTVVATESYLAEAAKIIARYQ